MTNELKELIDIQNELKAPKGQYNSFGNYKYRSAEDILEAVKPLLKKYGCQLTLSDQVMEVGGRIYVCACARIQKGENTQYVEAWAREAETKKGMDVSQITGTASSYARKYALNGLFLIDDTRDADTDAYKKQTSGVPKDLPKEEQDKLMSKITKDDAKKLIAFAQKIGWGNTDKEASTMLLGDFGVERLTQITRAEYATFIKEHSGE